MIRALLLSLALAALLPACKEKRPPAPGPAARPPAPPATPAPTPVASPPAPPAAPAPPVSLPDPFLLTDGARVKERDGWARRRAEIATLLQRTQYGQAPAAPASPPHEELSRETLFDGQVIRRRLRLDLGKGASLQVGLTAPAEGGPYPAIVHLDHRPELFGCAIPREVTARGYILAEITPTELCPDRPGVRGALQQAHPAATWGVIACWAWGASRVVDLLTRLEQVDREKLVVTGHSRSGKAALWAGALDERLALTAPMGSGCGGAGSYKVRGPGCERLDHLVRNFPHWFVPGLSEHAGQEERLPFDQHFVAALVAPRALLSVDAVGDRWANPLGTGATFMGAKPVFRFLGAEGRLGVAFRPGKHELADRDWRTLLDFADRLFGRDPQPGSAGRAFDRVAEPLEQAPFSWKMPGVRAASSRKVP